MVSQSSPKQAWLFSFNTLRLGNEPTIVISFQEIHPPINSNFISDGGKTRLCRCGTNYIEEQSDFKTSMQDDKQKICMHVHCICNETKEYVVFTYVGGECYIAKSILNY